MIKLQKTPIIVLSSPQGFDVINEANQKTIVLDSVQFMGSNFKYESSFIKKLEKYLPDEENYELIISPKAQEKMALLIDFNRIDS